MPKIDAIVAVAGWEERFLLGLKRDLEAHQPSDLLVFAFTEYLKASEENRRELQRFAARVGTRYVERQLPRDPVEVWSVIRNAFSLRAASSIAVIGNGSADVQAYARIRVVPAEEWFAISGWAKETSNLAAWQRGLRTVLAGWRPRTNRQAPSRFSRGRRSFRRPSEIPDGPNDMRTKPKSLPFRLLISPERRTDYNNYNSP